MLERPVLYTFRRCPYAMRARLAIAVSGLNCELREVALANKPRELLSASPKGTVPVLLLPNGGLLEQSLDIMLWALEYADPEQWLPGNASDRQDVLRLISENDGPFKWHLDRYKYPNRYGLPDGLDARSFGAQFLTSLEDRIHLQGPDGHLLGTRFGLADAALAPFVRQFAHTDRVWFSLQPWPCLQRWLAAFETMPLFQVIMSRQALWHCT